MYTFDTTGDGYDILHESSFIAHVPTIQIAKVLCSKLNELDSYVTMLNKMVDDRDAVINLIPECPAHGKGCLSHAEQWIKAKVDSTGIG
jgi:hypothetical protein